MKKVIVILGSAREDSNTLKALRDNLPFSDYEIIDLLHHRIEHYTYDPKKPDDDFLGVVEKMLQAGTIVFATPVYWYAMSGRLKVFMDRLTDLVTTSKLLGRALDGKSSYLFATGNSDQIPAGFEIPFKSSSEYLKMNYLGHQYVSVK